MLWPKKTLSSPVVRKLRIRIGGRNDVRANNVFEVEEEHSRILHVSLEGQGQMDFLRSPQTRSLLLRHRVLDQGLKSQLSGRDYSKVKGPKGLKPSEERIPFRVKGS